MKDAQTILIDKMIAVENKIAEIENKMSTFKPDSYWWNQNLTIIRRLDLVLNQMSEDFSELADQDRLKY